MWGKPLHNNNMLFELFFIETQSAGVSWLTILKKRDGYREAFGGFKLEEVAAYDSEDVARILNSGLIIKSRPKIEAIRNNAKLFLQIRDKYGSLDAYFWSKVGGKTIINDMPSYSTAACTSPISDAVTK